MKATHHLLAGSLALALSGLAGAGAAANEPEGFDSYTDDPRLGAEVERMCFNRQVRGFGETTDETIIIELRGGDQYLLETAGTCSGLEWARSISFGADTGCLSDGDTIRPSDSFFNSGDPDTPVRAGGCLIRSMHEWHPEAGEE